MVPAMRGALKEKALRLVLRPLGLEEACGPGEGVGGWVAAAEARKGVPIKEARNFLR